MSEDFDPDAYLKRKSERAGAFDPDAYLQDKAASGPPPQVGAGETIANRYINAIPGASFLTNAVGSLVGEFAPRESAVSFTPQGLAEMAARGVGPAQAKPRGFGDLVDRYRQTRDDRKLRDILGAEQNPWSARLGTGLGIAGSLALPMAKVGALGKGFWAGKAVPAMLTGAGYGAEMGLEHGSADLTRGEFGKAAGETGLGALIGLGIGAVPPLVSGGLERYAPQISNSIQQFANRKALNALGAMKPELNKLGTERAQEIGQAALDEGIVSPLASRATMAARANAGVSAEGTTLSDALSHLDAAANPGERIDSNVAADLVDKMAAELRKQPALANIATKFETEAANIRAVPNGGAMTLQRFEEEIARPYKRITNWNSDLALPKETLQKLPMTLEGEVERVGQNISNRAKNDALSKYVTAKDRFGKFMDLADVADEGLKRQASNRTFGLIDAIHGASMAAAGMKHGAPGAVLAGALGLGASKLSSRFGDQWAATGANALARGVRNYSPAKQVSPEFIYMLSEMLARRPAAMTPAYADGEQDQSRTLSDLLAGGR